MYTVCLRSCCAAASKVATCRECAPIASLITLRDHSIFDGVQLFCRAAKHIVHHTCVHLLQEERSLHEPHAAHSDCSDSKTQHDSNTRHDSKTRLEATKDGPHTRDDTQTCRCQKSCQSMPSALWCCHKLVVSLTVGQGHSDAKGMDRQNL